MLVSLTLNSLEKKGLCFRSQQLSDLLLRYVLDALC